MTIKKITLILALLFSLPFTLAAQRRTSEPRLEELPRVVIDTLSTDRPDVKVVIYSNNTWGYLYADSETKLAAEEFNTHWTTSLFAYNDIELGDLPPEVTLTLTDSLSHFHAPVVGKVYSRYGPRGRRNHNGIDIPLKIGEPVYAAFDGKVRLSRYNSGGFGNLVIVRHANGLETWYAHLVRRNVEENDFVKAGTVIGFAGRTGRSSGVHLHFEMRYRDQSFDPERIFDFSTGNILHKTFALNKAYFNIHSRASDQLEEDNFEGTVLAAADNAAELTAQDVLGNIATSGNSAGEASGDPIYHTIVQGDNLSSLAVKYGTSVKNLCDLNDITTKTTLKIGKKLIVSYEVSSNISSSASSDPLYHTIAKGDNLSTLALKYSTSVSNLCNLNDITAKTTLRIGRKLRVR